MKKTTIFITGTGTDVGKTLISAWLTSHLTASYFKPIQTGFKSTEGDYQRVYELTSKEVFPPIYSFDKGISPHFAAIDNKQEIILENIVLPKISSKNFIIEGAGGILVPLNNKQTMLDLIKYFKVAVILVANTLLGTINHTLLSIEVLKANQIPILGVILNGELHNYKLVETIQNFSKIENVYNFPYLTKLNKEALAAIAIPKFLAQT